MKRVVETTVGPFWISTVWLGIDHSFVWDDEPGRPHRPILFETMPFYQGDEPIESLHPMLQSWDQNEQWRWHTEAEAIAGHDQVVAQFRQLLADAEAADNVLREVFEQKEDHGDA
jgi:hypothetical protein